MSMTDSSIAERALNSGNCSGVGGSWGSGAEKVKPIRCFVVEGLDWPLRRVGMLLPYWLTVGSSSWVSGRNI